MKYSPRSGEHVPALLFVTLTVFLLTGSLYTVSCAQEPSYESLAILLNNVKSSKYRFSDHEGNYGEIAFEVLGEETVSGESTWKVEASFLDEEGGEPNIMTLWISKSTGQCLQVEMEGEVYTGDYAAYIGNSVMLMWAAWVGTWEEAWNLTSMYGWRESGYGDFVFLGSELRAMGPTQLFVYKYRWDGYATSPEDLRWSVEVWFAPVKFGTLLAYVYAKPLDKAEWYKIELLSVELVSPQPMPKLTFETSVDRERVTPGEEVTFSVGVSNNGEATGAHNLTIYVNNEPRGSEMVILEPGKSKSLSFRLSFTQEGQYEVKVGDKTFTITVSTALPARFEVSNLNISPSSLKVGQASTISVNVKNTGGESGSYEVVLKVNGEVVESKMVTLDPNQSTDVSFTFSPESDGTYNIDISGLTGSLTASRPAEEGPMAALGIPWFVLVAIPVVVVLVAVAVLLLRRKPKPKPEYPPPPPPICALRYF